LWGNLKEISHFVDSRSTSRVDGRMINIYLKEMAGDVAGVGPLGIGHGV
jgi:hypothetical protein